MSSRFASYGKKDTPWMLDGDRGFRGVWMPQVTAGEDRSATPPGYMSKSENRRIMDRRPDGTGASCTRGGKSLPGDFNPGFANIMIGSHIFSNPNGDKVMLIAVQGVTYVWALQFGKDPVKINIDVTDPAPGSGNLGTGRVNFVQAFEKVLLFRDPTLGAAPLIWDGVNTDNFMPVINPPFVPAPPSVLIPFTGSGTPFMDRILMYAPYWAAVPWRNQFLMSDDEDPTYYDPALGVFKIGAAVSDVITSIQPYFKGAAVVMMQDSIHLIENFTLDPFATTQRMLNGRLGSEGVYGPLMDGVDILFLSRSGNGFYRLSEVDVSNILAPPRPFSLGIQTLIDRIDWDRTPWNFCSEAVGRRAYFAIPLDRVSGAANAMLVYDMVEREWESAPDWWADAAFRINRLHNTRYDGADRLFALDYVAGAVYLMDDGLEDEGLSGSFAVQDAFASRGYDCGDLAGFKRFERALIGVRTYNPAATIMAVSDGVNERKTLRAITKDRTKFYTHGMADFDPVTMDPGLPRRKDYASDIATASAIEDFENLAVGTIDFIPPTSTAIFTGVMQQSVERPPIRQRGRWVSLEIANTQGRLDVLGCAVEGIPAGEGMRTLA